MDAVWLGVVIALIACANIAALLLARGSQRRQEISVRFSLGASRRAIVGQLLTEMFLLAVAGAAVGLIVAGATSSVFRKLAANLPRVEEIHLDARIVLYSLVCSVVVTLLCGLFPAMRAARESMGASLSHTSYTQVSSAMGHHVQDLGQTAFALTGEIRGIVGDAREEGLNREAGPIVYWCVSAPDPDPYYLVRTRIGPMAMAETIRKKIHELEPARSVFDMAPLTERLDESYAENRLRMVLLGFFAGTAVLLTCVGLYGTLSYSVSVRQREVGLRLALGAMRGQIIKKFVLQGLAVSAVGCAAGLVLAAAFARVLSGMLYGVSPTGVFTLSVVVLLMLVVAGAACLAPSIRAANVDPMVALRYE